MPTDGMLKDLVATMQDHNTNIMLWEGTPIEVTLQKLDKMGILISVFDPCANRPETADFMSVMRNKLHQLEQNVQLSVE